MPDTKIISGDKLGVPLLHQWDERWADKTYYYSGSNTGNTIAASACGPTSFTMIARWYGVDIFPPEACDFASDNGCHVSGGTTHEFFAKAAENWNFSMEQVGDRETVIQTLQRGYPVIASHGPGMFTGRGHFIVYAQLVGNDGLIVNDPNQGCGPNRNGDDYIFKLEDVLNDGGVSDWWIPTKDHSGCQPAMANQSPKGGKTAASQTGASQSGYKGFRIIPVGPNMVRIIKLPEKKCYAEPIYPDYVTVSDTVPKWVLDATTGYENQQLAEAQGEKISNGDAPEKAPNGTNYQENDIKYLIEHNGITREEAIKILEKDDKYTRKIKWNTDGTYNIDQTDKKESNNGGEKTNA